MRHNGDRSPEDIEREIARTRDDMDATLSAIEQRLTPGQIVDQGLDYLKRSGANEFVSNLGGSVKHNPLPVALVGIGLAWLMAGGNRRPSYMEGGSASASASGVGQRASESLSSARDSLTSAKDRLSQSASGARERVGQVGQVARQQAERMRSTYDSLVREQPLALGAVGLAIGAVLAAAAPRSHKEDELMGEASERLTERAKSAGKEQIERAKSAGKEQLEKMQQGSSPSRGDMPAQPARSEISAKPAAASPAPSPGGARESGGRGHRA